MIDNHFRKAFAKISPVAVRALATLNISPNHITIFAFLISSSAAISIIYGYYHVALVLWWSGRLLDAFDGQLARYTNKASPFGAFLDLTLDMMAYSIVVLGFFLHLPQFSKWWVAILVLYIGCITTALSLGTLMDKTNVRNEDNRGLRLGAGLAEGGETGIAYSLFLLFPMHLSVLLPTWCLVLVLTILFRFILAFKLSRNS
ncbi:MAG: CDP-alcohol phosphatidyltransferase family protein [Bacteriovoracaceae bacterium]|nr:CDP-alcohol phosphatidyltransferase family protein [Bacteriovoracaceae bacterium]